MTLTTLYTKNTKNKNRKKEKKLLYKNDTESADLIDKSSLNSYDDN